MSKSADPVATVIRANYGRIVNYIRSKVPEPDCYDLAQECVLALVNKDQSSIESPKAYLWGIVTNKIRRYYEQRTRSLVTVAVGFEALPVAVLSTRLSTKLARKNDVEGALQRLPLRQQQAFELHHVEELSIKECAAALGISVATVKRDIADARSRLARELGRDLGEEGDLRELVASYLVRQ
jgi:RNA polymerase sigma factor (sigma-70 family)